METRLCLGYTVCYYEQYCVLYRVGGGTASVMAKDPAAICACKGCAGLCRAVQGCAGLCRAVQGCAGRLSNHCSIACLHRHRSQNQTCIILHPRLENGSYARTCHTLLHFVTLFNTFLDCQPLCRHYTTGWGDLFHTL